MGISCKISMQGYGRMRSGKLSYKLSQEGHLRYRVIMSIRSYFCISNKTFLAGKVLIEFYLKFS